MKRKIFLTIAFIISLVPMIATQYGGVRGVREISGFANLWNPIGIISVILFLVGLWFPFKKAMVGKILGIVGLVGIIAAEIITFLTWPIPNYQDHINLAYSFENAFPEFYLGLTTSALMLITYVCLMSVEEHRRRSTRATTATPAKSVSKKSPTKKSRK